ncbi:MAG: hypothetical protein WCE23_06480 [Candidatus Binatus sp.]|uniref:hypothetical protein n=1 Tax=Candidatus Binatus sp. TaxID=2811406 RepID=UPI003C73171E
MKSKRSLMAVLAGLAILAAPITAAAFDKNNSGHNDSRPSPVSRSTNAPAHHGRSADVNGHGSHNNAAAANRDRHDNHNAANRGYGEPGYRGPGYGPGYRGPGYPEGYAGRSYPVGSPYYGAPIYTMVSSRCRAAQSVVENYYKDRNTGHPAAAADLLAQNQWAFHSGCR